MKSLREQIQGRCQHSTGDPNKFDPGVKCKAGVEFYVLANIAEFGRQGCALRLPCHGDTGETRGIPVSPCDKYVPWTEEMIQADIAQWEHVKACLVNEVSPCCNAPIDKSQVIRSGPHKNHGPRYCSKCGKLVFRV